MIQDAIEIAIEMKPNEVYGVSADDIETTPNEAYRVRQVSQQPQEPSYYDTRGLVILTYMKT